MEKSSTFSHFPPGKWRKVLLLMKLKLVFLLCCVYSLSANPTYSQQAKIDIAFTDRALVSVLDELQDLTGYQFFYQRESIPQNVRVTVERKGATLESILDVILLPNGLSYEIENKVVLINRSEQTQQPRSTNVAGVVRDAENRPMAGVTVTVKGTARGLATGADGRFSIAANQGDVIVFSFIGKKTQEVTYTGQQTLNVQMEDEVAEIEQVVITGMFNRRLESETGSSVQFSGQQLQEAGNQNVLRSLANLDPSFIMMESLEFGSDPNRMPEIQMRGQSSFPDLQGDYQGNPNQPLFILDGFEVGVEKIYDLDMNRVSSITILKDASAKAIYGSKAGNGVVVIETVRPQKGQLRISYSGTLDIDAPDLTGYNLMDAREKFEFENRVGMYNGTGPVEMLYGRNDMDKVYQAILRDITSGVDTYWLSKPLRTGVGQKHSISIDGGDDNFLYSVGINYNGVAGVMKGSDRSTLSGNMNFSYYYKGLTFRNTLELTVNNASNSPYGSFDEYTRLNPYWRTHDDEGELIPYWEFRGQRTYNPLYNATLNTKSTTDYTEIRDNFQMEWRVVSNLRLTGRFSFSRRTGGSDVFYPSNHTMFINYTNDQSNRRGRYTKGDSESTSYQADFGVNYSKYLGKHMFFANAAWNLSAVESSSHSYIAEGFGNDDMDDIAFGTQYPLGSSPSGSSSNQREVGVVGALNYSYDDRYLFDASVRTSGSSMFGSNNRWGLFWSLGAGWNIHNESFAQDVDWLDRFKIRGSVGYTGSQNFDPYQAKARYDYTEQVYDGGYGAILMGLPNTKLQWQRVVDYNVGADISLFNKVFVKFDYFVSVTDDLLIDVALPPSIGFPTYKENLGKVENKGFDVSVAVTPWRNSAQRGWLTVTLSAMHNKNTLKNVAETFRHRNNEQNDIKDSDLPQSTGANANLDVTGRPYTRPSTLFYEGQSMSAIWGVRSAGINPLNGQELFFDPDGNIKTQWSSQDQVVIGDTAPKLRGNINLNAGYKGFTFGIVCSYKFGGETYNSTLIDRVEYTSALANLDRRINQSWLEYGQIAPYRRLAIASTGSFSSTPTRPTSRFVMKDNELYVSSVNVGYDFQNIRALSDIGIERLKLSFFMNELVRFSAIDIERGTSYPFARNFSLSLQATF